MNKDPVKIGRINTRIEKALGHDFGDNIFCFVTESKLREFVSRWPKDYLKKVEEASNIIKEPLYVGINEEKKLLYFIKDYLIKNAFFKKACLILDYSKQLNLSDIILLDEKKMQDISKGARFTPARS